MKKYRLEILLRRIRRLLVINAAAIKINYCILKHCFPSEKRKENYFMEVFVKLRLLYFFE